MVDSYITTDPNGIIYYFQGPCRIDLRLFFLFPLLLLWLFRRAGAGTKRAGQQIGTDHGTGQADRTGQTR
jgi:hypothetical protein